MNSGNNSFDSLLDSLILSVKVQSGGVAKQALFSIAQCIAALCLAAGDAKCSSTVRMLLDILKLKDITSLNSVSHIHHFPFLLMHVCLYKSSVHS